MFHDDDTYETQTAQQDATEQVRGERVALIRDRIVLETVQMNLSGHVATAAVRLREGGRRASSRVVDRNVEARRPHLLGDAAARALTDLLPLGFGLILSDIHSITTEVGEALVAAVTLLTPEGEEVLMGVARADGAMAEAAVRAVLNAVNRRLSYVFADASLMSMN